MGVGTSSFFDFFCCTGQGPKPPKPDAPGAPLATAPAATAAATATDDTAATAAATAPVKRLPAAAAAAPAPIACRGCGSLIPLLALPVHEHCCLRKQQQQQRPAAPEAEAAPPGPTAAPEPEPIPLAPCQQKALQHVSSRASGLSSAAMGPLLERCKTLGFSTDELDSALAFVRERAPMVIHIHVPLILSLLIKDTHYRSLFETKSSFGTKCTATRKVWENAMFGGAYKWAAAAHRCKYGVLNPTGDVHGVVAAKAYGSSFLVLKDSVRRRVTLASRDTSGLGSSGLGTPTHYAHVLAEYSDGDLLELLGTMQSGKPTNPGTASATYKELQVHGDVLLDRDVELLVLVDTKGTPAAQSVAAEFGAKFGVPVVVSS